MSDGDGPGAGGATRWLSRRGLITGGVSAVAGAGVAVTAARALDDPAGPADLAGAAKGNVPGSTAGEDASAEASSTAAGPARSVVPFHGVHQPGIATPRQAYATFVSFDLRPGIDREGLVRWMRLWTDDARRLTSGEPALADTEPELAESPAALTVTVGVGRRVVSHAGASAPAWLGELPAFGVDRLDPAWCGGDLVLQVCGNNQMTVAHAVRMLSKDAREFAEIRWAQRGFIGSGSVPGEATPRNLMGQLDGTANPRPGTAELDHIVWNTDGPDWLRGGTSLVVRRIRMELDTWDAVDRRGREETIGRKLDNGAPLTGEDEDDEPDFDAVDESSKLTVIPTWAHIRRARPPDPNVRILRRPYNYDDSPGVDRVSDVGLVFASYQADVDAQFVPIQRRLDELDLLNEWTTPVGSAVFAILPGCADGEWLGQALLG